MASSEDPLAALAASAEQSGLNLLLIGAHALEQLGMARQTFDIDLMIAESDREALADLLREDGYALVAETGNFQRFSHADADLMDVDVLFIDAETFGKLLADAEISRRGGKALLVPSPAHFIALKLHAIRNNPKREARDLGDIAELLRARPGSLASEELEEICRAHGPEGVYSKLQDLV